MLWAKNERVNAHDVDDTLRLFDTLPSGVPDSLSNETTAVKYRNPAAENQYRLGLEAYIQWEQNGRYDFLERAADYYRDAAQISSDTGDWVGQAHGLYEYGDALILQGNHFIAMTVLMDAVRIFNGARRMTDEYYALGSLHKATVAAAHSTTNTEQVVWLGKSRSLQQRALEIYSVNEGEECDADAWRVEQNQMGISQDRKMGTDHVHDCIGIVLQNPLTKKTVLAHIDYRSDVSSLKRAFERLASSDAPTQTQVDPRRFYARIFGAGFDRNLDDNEHYQNAIGNIKKLVEFLDAYDADVELLSVAVLERWKFSAAVIDPISFELSMKWPGVPNSNARINGFKVSITETGSPLEFAFDLTISNERAAVYLARAEVAQVRIYIDETDLESYDRFAKVGYSDAQLAVVDEQARLLVEAYAVEIERLEARMTRSIMELHQHKVELQQDLLRRLVDALNRCPIHIGVGASRDNQELEERLVLGMNRVKVGTQTLSELLDELQRFEFSQGSYETIERRAHELRQVNSTLRENLHREQYVAEGLAGRGARGGPSRR
jgi:hypothetical protein